MPRKAPVTPAPSIVVPLASVRSLTVLAEMEAPNGKLEFPIYLEPTLRGWRAKGYGSVEWCSVCETIEAAVALETSNVLGLTLIKTI